MAMKWKGGQALLTVLTCVVLLPNCHSQGSPTVVIDGYTHKSTLTSGDSVPLGTQLILVCQVVGVPYGTPLNYCWTCPNGPCEVEGYYGRKIYNEHILAVNTTSTCDGGTYTCQVTATGGQEASRSFTLSMTGGGVVHSYGRLIPHEFPISDLQQIFGPDGIGRITCTVSSGTARFVPNGGQLETDGVTQTITGATATLVVSPSDVGRFQNRDLYCTNSATNFFYLFISHANPLSVPRLTVNTATSTSVEYQVERSDNETTRIITGYEVFRFGAPMIGECDNVGTMGTVTISPAVPGAQYRITAWALDSGTRRSAMPAVQYLTTGETRPSPPRNISVTRAFQDGVELNWLPPTEPNGEVHYVIYYTLEGGTEQSNNTGSNLTHYNLTGLERNRVYTNIAVQAVNSAGRSGRSALIAQYNHTPSDEEQSTAAANEDVIAVVVATFLVMVVVVVVHALMGVMAVVVGVRRSRSNVKRRGEESTTRNTTDMERNEFHDRSGIELGEVTREEKGTKDYTVYVYMNEESSTEGNTALYQDLDVGTQDYDSVYTQLKGGTYQELDPQGREEEHHYQRVNKEEELTYY